MEAADEIGLAVIATTFTLIAVFLPTAFMTGVVGKFFVQFGWTAAIAVWFSLVVARLLTPMMAAYLLQPQAKQERSLSRASAPRWKACPACATRWAWEARARSSFWCSPATTRRH
jgi:multidrug efflux pump subunit AcrB